MHTVKKGIKAPSVPYSGLDRHSLRIKAGKEDTINMGLSGDFTVGLANMFYI